jgi:hypothetical protein
LPPLHRLSGIIQPFHLSSVISNVRNLSLPFL